MPVGSDQLYKEKRAILTVEADAVGKDVLFPMDFVDQGPSRPEVILGRIANADFLVADLSKCRPSCYFEVGLAQGMGQKCVLLAELGTEIHQVLGRQSVSFYNDLENYRTILRLRLHASLC